MTQIADTPRGGPVRLSRLSDWARERTSLLALPAVGASAVLGLFQLGEPSIWIDEAFTAELIRTSYHGLIDELQWGHFSLVKAWSAVAGTSEAAMRIPSVVGAVAAVAVLYGFARRYFGVHVAVVASLLMALNPFVVQWSQQARGYTILLTLVIAATWLLLRAHERNDIVAWAEYGLVFLVLVCWQPFSAALFLPVHLVVGWRNKRFLVASVAAGAYSLLWLERFYRNGPESGLPTEWIPDPSLLEVASALSRLSGAMGVGLVLGAVGAVVATKHRRLLVAWAALPFGLALAATPIEPVFVSRYLIVSCPAFALLGAIAIVSLTDRWRALALSAASVATVVGLALWYVPDDGENWAGENWRGATAMVMREAGGAEVSPYWTGIAFEYYGGRRAETGWIIEWRAEGDEFASSPLEVERFGPTLRVLFKSPEPAARQDRRRGTSAR